MSASLPQRLTPPGIAVQASPSADAGDDEEEEDEGKASAARKRSSRPRRDT